MSRQVVDRADYSYLRPKKAEMVKGFHSENFEKRNDISAKEYSNATILPLRKCENKDILAWGIGGVLDSNMEYIQCSRIPKIIDYGYLPNETLYSEKTVIYCGYFKYHWGDFIAYCLPRLWYVLKNSSEAQEYVFFTDDNKEIEISGNFKLLIERLGIFDKVSFVSSPTTFKSVIVPEMSYIQNEYYSKQYIDTLDYIHNNIIFANIEKVEKIFLTRSKLKKSISMETGIDMLDNYFEKNGYKVLSPESITLDEMVLYLDNAKEIACISGTLPHNLLLTREQAKSKKLYVIERNALFNFVQPDTDKMLNCEITYIDANISLYPVALSYGPFVFAWTEYIKRFSEENNMLAPDDRFLDEENKKQLLKKYMRAYRLEYQMCLYMPVWMQKYVDVIFEAYYDGEEYFGDYLREQKPFKTSQKPPFSYFVRIFRKLFKD